MKINENNLVMDYQNGMSWNDLCIKYNVSTCSIHKILNKFNVTRSRVLDSSWSEEKIERFKTAYLSNTPYPKLQQEFQVTGGGINYWVNKLQLPKRGSGRNNNFENKFDPLTPEAQYWLGYLLADGHIESSEKRRAHYLYLCSEKEYVVDKFIHWYNNNPKKYQKPYMLKDGTVKTLYKAVLNDKTLVTWFREHFKVESKKHHNLNPNVEITWDLLRGFFDGDGSASKHAFQLKSCSKSWLERIQTFLRQSNIESYIKLSYKDCYGLYIYKKEELKKLGPLLYNNPYYCHEYKYKLLEPYISDNISKSSELLENLSSDTNMATSSQATESASKYVEGSTTNS